MRARASIQCALIAAALVLAGAGARAARAADIEHAGRPVKREILALYDGEHESLPHLTRIHRFAEMPLNWLGFTLAYHDIGQPLPEGLEVERYRAVLSWFLEPMRNSEPFLRWADRATRTPLRYIVIGEIAPAADDSAIPALQRIFERLGIEFTGVSYDMPLRARVLHQDRLIGFERPLDRVVTSFPIARVRSSEATAHLSVSAPREAAPATADVVVTGPKGGFAVHEFTIFYEPTTDRSRWIVDPFEFFRRSLGAERMPAPDVTTLAGRRIYFSHIDGDGWNNLAESAEHRARQLTAAEVIAAEVIEPYPDLPVSVGLIAGDALPLLGGTPASQRVARRLFALPQVEVASHTHTHPFDWGFFERYDRSAELALVGAKVAPQPSLRQRLSDALSILAGRGKEERSEGRYISGSSDLPRSYLKQAFNLELEVAGALSVAEGFAPPGKRAKLYLWSGNTTPFEAAVRATRAARVRNLNGGDSRFDQEYPSIIYLPPVGRVVGRERQIYAANSNENTYTNDWTGPFFGMFMLQQTLDNTELPRRLKPFNLYYHMYSGEKASALAAIKHFVALARRSPVIPVTASDYAAIADSFYGVEIEQVQPAAWRIGRRGSLSTVRFDDAGERAIDTAASTGVLGYRVHAGSLYVALDPAVQTALVVLGPAAGEDREQMDRVRAALVESRWQLFGRSEEACGLRISAQGFGRGDMVWRTPPGQSMRMTASREGRTLWEEVARADGAGLLRIAIDADAIEPLQLRLACHD